MFRLLPMLAVTAALAAPATALAQGVGCVTSGFRFGLGIPQADTQWIVAPGRPCARTLRPAGTTMLQRITIEQPARVGVAGIGSRYQFAYNPRAGQTQDDQFVLRIDFQQRGVAGVTRVRVAVAMRRKR